MFLHKCQLITVPHVLQKLVRAFTLKVSKFEGGEPLLAMNPTQINFRTTLFFEFLILIDNLIFFTTECKISLIAFVSYLMNFPSLLLCILSKFVKYCWVTLSVILILNISTFILHGLIEYYIWRLICYFLLSSVELISSYAITYTKYLLTNNSICLQKWPAAWHFESLFLWCI